MLKVYPAKSPICCLADHESPDGKIRPHWHCDRYPHCLKVHVRRTEAETCGRPPGRRRKGQELRYRRGIAIQPALMEYAASLAGGNLADGVEIALEYHRQHHG